MVDSPNGINHHGSFHIYGSVAIIYYKTCTLSLLSTLFHNSHASLQLTTPPPLHGYMYHTKLKKSVSLKRTLAW